jgi:molybdate transport system regulatory protein
MESAIMMLDGRFWLTKDDKNFLGTGRIELLKRIDTTGSMNAAAKEMKMSYKAAWERVNSMNELADKPLIERQTGGKGGGGTKLTAYARELIETYERLNELHRQFIERFSQAADSPEHLAKILNRLFLSTSARNQLLCKITHISYDNIHSKISMKLNDSQQLTSTITTKSMSNLNLNIGDDVYAIIKSSDVKISREKPKESENRNLIEVVVKNLESNETHTELSMQVDKKKEIVALVSHEEAQKIKIGDTIYALIDYNKIIIGT